MFKFIEKKKRFLSYLAIDRHWLRIRHIDLFHNSLPDMFHYSGKLPNNLLTLKYQAMNPIIYQEQRRHNCKIYEKSRIIKIEYLKKF